MEAYQISVLVGIFVGVTVAGALLFLARKLTDVFPESLKVFGPTSRTIGGPGNFKGSCKGEIVIFRGGANHIISVTLENMGSCDIQLELRDQVTFPSTDITATVPPGATMTVCGFAVEHGPSNKAHWSTHSRVTAKCMGSESSDSVCKYRWRIDSLGYIPNKDYVTH